MRISRVKARVSMHNSIVCKMGKWIRLYGIVLSSFFSLSRGYGQNYEYGSLIRVPSPSFPLFRGGSLGEILTGQLGSL